MLKKNRSTFILTTLVTLLPMLAGLLLWNRLPDSIATHFNFQGVADGWSSKGFAVFGLPLILLAAHLVCSFMCCIDPKNKNSNEKVLRLVMWTVPPIALVTCGGVYAVALGFRISMSLIIFVMIGVLFIIIGNYLPKCQRNYTVGIKVPWTLDSDENWERTHRFAGKVWVLGGFVMMLCPLFAAPWLLLAVLAVLAVLPILYSYLYYCRHQTN